MQVLGIGIIFITLVIKFTNKNISILNLLIIFSFFSVIGFVNIGSIGIGIDKAMSYIILILFLLHILNTRRVYISFNFIIFSLIAILIVILPLLFSYEIVRYFISDKGITTEVINAFSIKSIIKSIELLFPILLYIVFYNLSKNWNIESAYKILYFTLFVICLTGLFDYLPFSLEIWNMIKTNIAYPTIVGGIESSSGAFRLSGITPEPSHLVVFAAFGFNMTLSKIINGSSNFLNTLLILYFTVIGLLTYSPSFFIIIFPAIIYSWTRTTQNIFKVLYIFIILMIFISSYMLGYIDIMINDMMIRIGSESIDNSSQLRTVSHILAFETWYDNYLMGVGFGNFLLPVGYPTLVLVSTGLFGITFLIFILFRYISKLIDISKLYSNSYKYIWNGFMLNAIGLLFMGLFTKGYQIFLHLPYIIIIILPLLRPMFLERKIK
jgi:hypothetical protein